MHKVNDFKDWILLIEEAKKIGISIDEIREFLK
ncbi:MAG TPA: anti-repressor SinI family protein [Candidatus Saccharimonadales bacterium]|nr:anti-repressor SinI family protein [Candidatus Saccharimonadales bacterium]